MKAVTDANFEEVVLKSSKPVVVQYWAEWDSQSTKFIPIMEEIATEHGDKAAFVQLNIDQNPDTSAQARILQIPMVHVFSGGEVVKEIKGLQPKRAVVGALAEFIR